MTPEITYKKCPVCEKMVELNGVGSGTTPFSSFFSGLTNKLFPYACEMFDTPARLHDFDYHGGHVSKEVADKRFRNRMQAIADEQSFFKKLYLRMQANTFYKAVQIAGQDSYDAGVLECQI